MFAGTNTTSYVCNAVISQDTNLDNKGGYTWETKPSCSAFFITWNNDITVYMDNCNLEAWYQPICIRNDNNTLYISNTTVTSLTTTQIQVSYNSKVYIGEGCNFTAENADKPDNVTITDKVYTKQ